MSSFASIVKRVVLLNIFAKGRNPSPSGLKDPQSDSYLIPLPPALSNRIPQELFERFIGYLYDDIPSLGNCCLVCRAWFPASRYHITQSLIVLPLVLSRDPDIRVKCSVAFRGAKFILYGTEVGIYMADRAAQTRPYLVLDVPDVTHIDVLETHDILVFLSAHRVMTYPLHTLDPAHASNITECIRVSSHVSSFKVGLQNGQHLVCVVKSGPLSTVFKLMIPVALPASGSFKLQLYREFYIPTRTISIHFLPTKLVAGTNDSGFELIDIITMFTQSLPDPAGPLPLPDLKSAKCLAAYPAGDEFLLCYNTIAVYVNNLGMVSRTESIRWRKPIEALAFRDPYVLAFSSKHIELRYIKTGELLQTIWIRHSLLCTSPDLFMIQAVDGRLIGLHFSD